MLEGKLNSAGLAIPQNEISRELTLLSEAIAQQSKYINSLESSISPILSQMKTGVESSNSPPKALLVPLATNIRDLREMLESNNQVLSDLISKVQL